MNTAQPTKQIISILALAMHVSILIFCGVVFFLASQAPIETPWSSSFVLPEGLEILAPAFIGLAFVQAGLAIYFPVVAAKNDPSATPDLPANDDQPKSKLFFDFDKIDAKMMSLTVVRFALAESIAIFGFVLSFMAHTTVWIMAFAFVALVIQTLVGPFGAKLLR